MELANGRGPPTMGYQTKVPKEAIDALQTAYGKGASEADLFNIAAQYRVGLPSQSVRNLINARDRDRRPGKFVPKEDRSPPPEPIRADESISEYVDRVQGGRFEWTGPYTPRHPFGRNTDEQLRGIFTPWVGHDEAEHFSTAAQAGIPVLGAMQAVDDALAAARSRRPQAAAANSVVALASIFPGTRSVNGTVRVIDVAALRRAAADVGGGFDAALAVRSAVEEGLASGGRVSLRSGTTARRIVGTNDAGALVDEAGKAWGPPKAGQRLEIRIPPDQATAASAAPAMPFPAEALEPPGPAVRQAGHPASDGRRPQAAGVAGSSGPCAKRSRPERRI
jgi:hypothetical protein